MSIFRRERADVPTEMKSGLETPAAMLALSEEDKKRLKDYLKALLEETTVRN